MDDWNDEGSSLEAARKGKSLEIMDEMFRQKISDEARAPAVSAMFADDSPMRGPISEIEKIVRAERARGAPLMLPLRIVLSAPQGAVEVLADGFDALMGHRASRRAMRRRPLLTELALAGRLAESRREIEAEAGQPPAPSAPLDPFEGMPAHRGSDAVGYALRLLVQSECPDFLDSEPRIELSSPFDSEPWRRGINVIRGVFSSVDAEVHPGLDAPSKLRMRREDAKLSKLRSDQAKALIAALGPTAVWSATPRGRDAADPALLWGAFFAMKEALALSAAAKAGVPRARKKTL